MKKIGIVLVVLIFPLSFFAKFSNNNNNNNNNNNIMTVIIVGFFPTVSEPWWKITSVMWL
jgi:hypothetical protein